MTRNRISCCYFPTTAIFIDDNAGYLKTLESQLDKQLAYHFNTSPLDAVELLNKHCNTTPYIKKWLSNLSDPETDLGSEIEHNEFTHSYIDVDIQAIHKEIYSPLRFDEISLVIVDYAMPLMNGVQFCEKLAKLPVKKLMLTGQASFETGVNALNEKIIDKFIVKEGTTNFRDALNNAINELQHQYFTDLSTTVIDNLVTDPNCCLDNSEFIDFFNNLCQKHNFIEYYLVKHNGSMLLLDIKGNPSWLVVKTTEEIEGDYQLAADNGFPKDIIESLKNREKLAFHVTEDDFIKYNNEHWHDFLHPAKKLSGNVYYSLIKGSSEYNIRAEDIASYDSYLKKL